MLASSVEKFFQIIEPFRKVHIAFVLHLLFDVLQQVPNQSMFAFRVRTSKYLLVVCLWDFAIIVLHEDELLKQCWRVVVNLPQQANRNF